MPNCCASAELVDTISAMKNAHLTNKERVKSVLSVIFLMVTILKILLCFQMFLLKLLVCGKCLHSNRLQSYTNFSNCANIFWKKYNFVEIETGMPKDKECLIENKNVLFSLPKL